MTDDLMVFGPKENLFILSRAEDTFAPLKCEINNMSMDH
jgi:hypothetical protein